MCNYENESGYESDAEMNLKKLESTYCQYCRKFITGPRIGFIVHLATRHTDKTLLEISKQVKGSEMQKMVGVRKMTIQRILNN